MQTIFTYGSRKSAVTPKTILFGKTLYLGDTRIYVPNHHYEVEDYIGALPSNPLEAIALVKAGNHEIIISTIASIKAYRPKSVAWYDQRVSKNSGGKQQNYRDNRAAVEDGLSRSQDILTRGLLALQNKKVAEAEATLPTLPPGTVIMPDGTIVPAKGSAAASDSGISKLILPIGAGLAALFFLKGH